MSSSVFYKFASQRAESRVTFDGTGISVFDLKREIILANNLGKANDFDLFIYDSSNQEYKDDSQIIPRSTSVIVKRRPAVRPGKGKAAMYISGASGASSEKHTPTVTPANNTWHRPGHSSGHLSKRFDAREKERERDEYQKPVRAALKTLVATDDETAAMAAMFQAQSANWEETQEKMSQFVFPAGAGSLSSTRIDFKPRAGSYNSRGGKPFSHQPEKPLPPSYVCYRCGQKGHWIQDCPTNNDRDFDNKPRIKRTTGIPRSFLKSVDSPSGQLSSGVMVTPEGGFVVAQPDSAAWQKQVSRPKGFTEADIRERKPTDPSLTCPIDNRLFRDAVKTPCCEKAYCEDCIQTHLLENDFSCPNCQKRITSLDKLIVNKPLRTRVGDYIDRAMEESRKEAEALGSAGTPTQSTSTPEAEQGPSTKVEEDDGDLEYQADSIDIARILNEGIPQLQAQIAQLSKMLQNPSLPPQARHPTEYQLNQLQGQLTQAQAVTAFAAAASTLQQQAQQQQAQQQQQQQIQQQQQQQAQAQQQQQMAMAMANGMGMDSAYQRLPVNNRRKNLKRDRPSDFLEVGGGNDPKVARYWE
ncbi:DWNN domain-containing protein [Thelephora terrestris]|uniref:DWNN domain-containing protein n=1 Tax=Thelephora terrestris TaxID=56493 RepID=A0A9P6HGG4_9AGAM|nr:DWNN domain-containing protein [Thelephora terrestris]